MAETKPDAVAICTYPDTHEPLAIKAIEAGCHVFVEKPIALNVEEGEAMIEKSKATGCQVQVGQVIRFWDEYVKLKEILGCEISIKLLQYNHGFGLSVL